MPRLTELLADRAAQGLPAAEEAELELLLDELSRPMDESLEMAAAAAYLAMCPPAEQTLPAPLKNRLIAAGEAWVAHREAGLLLDDSRNRLSLAGLNGSGGAIGREMRLAPLSRRGEVFASLRTWGGWVAAAACLTLAVVAWTGHGPAATPQPVLVATTQTPFDLQNYGITGPGASPREMATVLPNILNQLSTDRSPDVFQANLAGDANAPIRGGAISGVLCWKSSIQAGVVKLHGLPALNRDGRSGNTYQLWIYDETRDSRYPVNGGVFDVPEGKDDVYVHVSPRLHIGHPTKFVVTIEQEGGVVVSDMANVVVTGEATAHESHPAGGENVARPLAK